tara:strand:- start:527 stop:793 length:267 start_codon:yes stop_codon:yes gene_type:complete
MKFTAMKGQGFIGQLVKARQIKSLYHDQASGETIEEHFEKRRLGFIIDLHEYIDDYFLIRFFDGSSEWCWKVDLLSRKNLEISLDNLR